MIELGTIRAILRYNDWADELLLTAAGALSDGQLDHAFDIGRGSLRKTLLHIIVTEEVWAERWRGHAETPWPNEEALVSSATMRERLKLAWKSRDDFLATVPPDELVREVVYRDSFGSLYRASLGDMMLHSCLHSTHHRAQVVNMFRRLGAMPPELDYMYWIRRPAKDAGSSRGD